MEVAGGGTRDFAPVFSAESYWQATWAPGGSPRALVGDHAVWGLDGFQAMAVTVLEQAAVRWRRAPPRITQPGHPRAWIWIQLGGAPGRPPWGLVVMFSPANSQWIACRRDSHPDGHFLVAVP